MDTESTLKIMKNAFYFNLKALKAEKRLFGKTRLITKFVTSKSVAQTIAIHILPNISKSKCNQAMKFCQLLEHIT